MVLAGDDVLASDVSGLDTRVTTLETRVGCRLRRNATQSVNTGATTAISWDLEEEDTHGFIVATSSTVTIPSGQAGLYDTTYRAAGNVDAASRFIVMIAVTSSVSSYPTDFRMPTNGTEDSGSISVNGLDLVAGDTIQYQVFHGSAAAVNFTAWMSLYRRPGS